MAYQTTRIRLARIDTVYQIDTSRSHFLIFIISPVHRLPVTGAMTQTSFHLIPAAIHASRSMRSYPHEPKDVTSVPEHVPQAFWMNLLDARVNSAERVARATFAFRVMQLNKSDFSAEHLLVEGMTQAEVTAALETATSSALPYLLYECNLDQLHLDDISSKEIKQHFDGVCILVRQMPAEKKAAFLVHLDTVVSTPSTTCRAVQIIKPYEEETMQQLPVHIQVMVTILFPYVTFSDRSLESMRIAAKEAVQLIHEKEDTETASDESDEEDDEPAGKRKTPADLRHRKRKHDDNDDDDDETMFPPKRLPASKQPAKRR